jgi:ribonucleoside-diphosphate reductase alpha chain
MHNNPAMQKLLEDRYYLRDEEGNLLESDPRQMYERVAATVAQAEKQWDSEDWSLGSFYWQEQFYALMVQNKFLPNTPLLINAGKESPGSYSACFYIPVEDSMDGIFDAVKQAAIISKSGGGVGFNFSSLRPKGSIVKSTGHKASGPVSFMRVFNTMCDTISQGGVRRGAMIAELIVSHPDILEFIQCKDDGVSFTNFNISVIITDDFMKAVENKQEWSLVSTDGETVSTIDAEELWNEICSHAWKTGDPGLIFIDRMREDDPEVAGTNPCGEIPLRDYESCIAKDELVLTQQGFKPIQDITSGEYVASIKDGKTIYAKVSLVKNNGIRDTYIVVTKEGYKVRATEDHRFLTVDGWKEVQELREDDELILGAVPFLPELEEEHLEWELLGWMHGDGWFTENSVGVSFNYNDGDWEAKDKLLPVYKEVVLNGSEIKPLKNDGISYQIQTERKSAFSFIEKYGVLLSRASERELPSALWAATLEQQRAFLRGYITADGGVTGKANSQYKIASSNRKMLEQVQLLLTRFGIGSWISTNMMENYPKRKPQSQLVITGEDARLLVTTVGFLSSKKYDKFDLNPSYNAGKRQIVRVESIEYVGTEEVYDIEVPYTRNFIVNGLVAHNCNLGSINLLAYVKEIKPNTEKSPIGGYEFDFYALQRDIPTMVRFLDDVIDVNHFPLPEIDEATKKTRKIGLGVMGWADTLIKLKIPYDSDDAIILANQIAKLIYEVAYKESANLAEEKGYYPLVEDMDTFRRNYTLTCVAPTGTISRIAGVSSGIEPVFAWQTHHKLVDLEYDEVHWAYEDFRSNPNNDALMLSEYMKTAMEIDPEWHVKHQSAWQKYIDNSVSKTINLSNSATVEDVKEIYQYAYDSDCKGITIYRDGCRADQPLNDITINVDAPDADRFAEQVADLLGVLDKPIVQYRNRGPVAIGATHKVETSKGKIYITVNYDRAQQEPNEVFIRLGTTATPMEISLAEWAGRLLSICLKHNVSVADIQRQSNKIFSDASFVYDSHIFSSLPQAVSHLINSSFDQYLENVGLEDTMANKVIFEPEFNIDTTPASKAIWYCPPNDALTKGEYCYNCGEYAMIRDSGCYTCTNCGAERCG